MSENNTVQNTTLNVSLPEPLKEYVQDRVSEGIYSNASDYVRSLIREDMQKSAERRLEAYLLEGINSGPATAMTLEDWAALEADLERHVAERHTPNQHEGGA